VKEYQRYRKIGRELSHKIIDAYLSEAVLDKAAKMLKLGGKRQLVLDSEDDLSVLMDFALYEVRQKDGKNQVERYAEEKGGVNFIERDLLTAMERARTGLYKVSQVMRDKYQIGLENLLDSQSPIVLTDINFSETMKDGLVIYFRPIQTSKFTMTSGIAFVFPMEMEEELMKRWQRLEWKGDAERYAWFFRKSKQSGFETMYV